MMFSKKKIISPYTMEQCTKCSLQRKRKFAQGDVLFLESSKCTSCDGMMRIEKIFGETIDQKIINYFVLYFTLQEGQNQDSPSPCSLNMIPLHFGQGLISSLNFIPCVFY